MTGCDGTGLAYGHAPASSVPRLAREHAGEHAGYAREAPADVARQLRDAAGLFAGVLELLTPGDRERTPVRVCPPGGGRDE
jgi:hypothetical protein